MEDNCYYLPITETGFFSAIAMDYVTEKPALRPFYEHSVSLDGIKAAIAARQKTKNHRTVLQAALLEQYSQTTLTEVQQKNLNALLLDNTFTITTAHQPNIFTGPLYFIYKIIHAIQQAQFLQQQLPEYNFVPFYYMGSEDADLEELGTITLQGKKLTWLTNQTGAVGRMKVDKLFLSLIEEIKGQINVLPYGEQLSQLFANAYTLGKTIQQATFELVNNLFADFGLLILIPDNAALKKVFEPVVEKELLEQFSHKAIASTINALQEHYPIQTQGRSINLFYLTDTYRERIEWDAASEKFVVKNTQLQFTKKEMSNELRQYPERFSGNVILRGLFQETILPNIIFIGGGGELAYWLELKNVFAAAAIPYPVLLLRNSFVLADSNSLKQWQQMQFTIADLFKHILTLQQNYVLKHSNYNVLLDSEIKALNEVYEQMRQHAVKADATLEKHVLALQHKALEKINVLQKKIIKAEKRKHEIEMHKLERIKNALFPNNHLQERVENFSVLYAHYGPNLLHSILKASKQFGQKMGIIELP